jgi:hypothetical protein
MYTNLCAGYISLCHHASINPHRLEHSSSSSSSSSAVVSFICRVEVVFDPAALVEVDLTLLLLLLLLHSHEGAS